MIPITIATVGPAPTRSKDKCSLVTSRTMPMGKTTRKTVFNKR